MDDCESVDPLHFVPFSAEMKLVQVIVGQRSELSRNKLARCLGKTTTVERVFKARSGFKKFVVVENTLKSAWQ